MKIKNKCPFIITSVNNSYCSTSEFIALGNCPFRVYKKVFPFHPITSWSSKCSKSLIHIVSYESSFPVCTKRLWRLVSFVRNADYE